MDVPIENTYWVVPGRFLAGEYPRTFEPDASRKKLGALVVAGVSRFVDLTRHDDHLEPYDHLLAEIRGATARRTSFPIRDESIPDSPRQMKEILDYIDQELSNGQVIYVHCWGGVGRTGTVVGCWLARHFGAKDARRHLASVWKQCAKSSTRHSPETGQQERYVEEWHEDAPPKAGWCAVIRDGILVLDGLSS